MFFSYFFSFLANCFILFPCIFLVPLFCLFPHVLILHSFVFFLSFYYFLHRLTQLQHGILSIIDVCQLVLRTSFSFFLSFNPNFQTYERPCEVSSVGTLKHGSRAYNVFGRPTKFYFLRCKRWPREVPTDYLF